MKRYFGLMACVFLLAASANSQTVTQGSLVSLDSSGRPRGLCPLKHTDVKAEISGFLARATVRQEFENPYSDKIEAVYTFPLPHDAAVNDMTMLVGSRVVKGTIKRREEAAAIYQAARERGHVASLLDQERPNIFTQSVANIMPGEKVTITITYIETLTYENGWYEFVFPMVVGPRYVPGRPVGKQAGGWSPDTDRVPDASRITPPVTPRGARAGHDISIEVAVDAGVPIDIVKSATHQVDIARPSIRQAVVRLKDSEVIPNKDFVLRYDVSGRSITDSLLVHRSEKGGFFTLIVQPPDRIAPVDLTPKELVFVLDTSGSMSGFPIEKAKQTMRLALDGLNPQDTFNLITFAGDTHILFPEPVPATPEYISQARAFLETRAGGGGTEMMKAIRAALDPSDKQNHIRVVCFMTDGYVGNDLEIISEVQRHPNARVFSFGIGSSVNRFLLDSMAKFGRGEVEYVGLNDNGDAAAKRFHERVRNPLLTDITIDWSGLPVADVYPQRIPDLFGAKPVIISGRYTAPARGVVRLRAKMAGRPFARDIRVELPASEAKHDVLASLWARRRIGDLMAQDFGGIQEGRARTDIREAITDLGLSFRLVTQFTSFVAVEEMTVTDGGQPRKVEVPVEMPEGVSYEGVFGDQSNLVVMQSAGLARTKQFRSTGFAGGVVGGVIGGVPSGLPAAPSPPPPPMRLESQRTARAGSREDRSMLGAAKPEAKLAPELARALKPSAGARVPPFIKNGKAEIRVWLTSDTPAIIEKLKRLGFEVMLKPNTAKMLIGRIALDKLEALSRIAEVRYIAPAELR